MCPDGYQDEKHGNRKNQANRNKMIAYPIAIDRLDSSTQFHDEVLALLTESKEYLSDYPWCAAIKSGWLFVNIGRVACIFLFEIENTQSPEDNLIWIVAGDFPTMYTDTYSAETTQIVLETYIYLANEWIDLAEQGRPMDDCFPFEVPADRELMDSFRRRVVTLQQNILPHIDNIHYQAAFNTSPLD
jgi:hypothetical protein